MIKIGIIGMGRMGITHYSILNTHKDVKIVSVADSSKVILQIINKYIKDIQTFSNYKELIDNSTLDAILVCTPPNFHYEIVKYAFKKRLHVFVEKPFTTNFLEAKELTDLFNQSNLVNQVGYVNRYNDVFIKVRELIKTNLIGNLIGFKSEMYSCTILNNQTKDNWRNNRKSGGGVIYEMASHAIDLINYFIGTPDKIIGTIMKNIYSQNVEDIVTSNFVYRNGIYGSINVNWSDESYRKPINKIEIFGFKGKIIADQYSLKIYLRESDNLRSFRKGWNTVYITDIARPVEFYLRGNEFTRQLYNFIELIKQKPVENFCTFNDALNTHYVIENMFKDVNNNMKL